MGRFDPVTYKSLANNDNTFNRLRQKTWGVFIVSEYKESIGEPVPINASSMKDDYTLFGIESSNIAKRDYSIKGYKPDVDIPKTGPEGEEIISITNVSILKDGAVQLGTKRILNGSYYVDNKPYYADSDVLYDNVKIYYYYSKVKDYSWNLVLLTKSLQEAKDKVNDWLRLPEIGSTYPIAGINSVMITEIIPSDSIIEL
ncbi:hypothetical protein INTERNEXUS_237 [Bacillus phage vB_BspM_Internexus]|nr:hypothetical protein INTERNEXUS_237 [Bacillus phage vB_BspM_Internexus]